MFGIIVLVVGVLYHVALIALTRFVGSGRQVPESNGFPQRTHFQPELSS